METILIFDFDHTLFNARDLRKDLSLLIVGDENITSELIWEEFSKPKNKISKFLQENAQKYVFPKVKENLGKLKSKKILLSYGNLAFQKKKIENSGLYDLFDEVILTEKNKIKFLPKFYTNNKDKEIFLINDTYNKRFRENEEIKREIPEINILEVDNYQPELQKNIDNIFKVLFAKKL
jgi:FMN phosphatase YigB (HAD superfamily)